MCLGSSCDAFCKASLAAPGNVTHPFPIRASISLFSGSISIMAAAADEVKPQGKVRFDNWGHRRAVLPSGAAPEQKAALCVCVLSAALCVPPLLWNPLEQIQICPLPPSPGLYPSSPTALGAVLSANLPWSLLFAFSVCHLSFIHTFHWKPSILTAAGSIPD